MAPWRYGRDEFRLLTNLHRNLGSGLRATEPFVPYVGSEFGLEEPRIMVLGKATEGNWRVKPSWGYGFETHAERFVLDSVATEVARER